MFIRSKRVQDTQISLKPSSVCVLRGLITSDRLLVKYKTNIVIGCHWMERAGNLWRQNLVTRLCQCQQFIGSELCSIDQFRYIKIQPKTIDLSTRLLGMIPTNSVFIPTSLVLRSIVLGWILIYRNWSIDTLFILCADAYSKMTALISLILPFSMAIL